MAETKVLKEKRQDLSDLLDALGPQFKEQELTIYDLIVSTIGRYNEQVDFFAEEMWAIQQPNPDDSLLKL
jgi:hypothetical protein